MFYTIVFLFYLLSVIPYGLARLTPVDLYGDSNVFSAFISFMEAVLLLYFYLLRNSFVRAERPRALEESISMHRWFYLYLGTGLVILVGYISSEFVLKYVLRESISFFFFLSFLQTLFYKALDDPQLNWTRLQEFTRRILFLHIAGIICFTLVYFDYDMILDKLVRDPLFTHKSALWDRIAFFALAGNEEAYTMLIFLLLSIGGLKRRTQLLILFLGIVFLLYLGSRTAFLLSLVLLMVWVFSAYKSFSVRLTLASIPLVLGFVFRDEVLFYASSAFKFINNFDDLFNLSIFLEEDNLALRIHLLWIPILDKLLSDGSFFVGISVNGLNEFKSNFADNYTALHNTFLYFFAAGGIFGLLMYISGFRLMILSFLQRKRHENGAFAGYYRNYFLAVVAMLIYSLMNNAYSIQGMMTYAVLIVYGFCLNDLSTRTHYRHMFFGANGKSKALGYAGYPLI